MATYDDIAEWYDAWVGPHSLHHDPYFPSVQTLMGEFAGQRICDLACGQGRVARHLADEGARVVGIDLSQRLLAIARRLEDAEPRGIEYQHADAAHLDLNGGQAFDGVVCHMALMDIAELEPTLVNVARILRFGGWFVFSILHPCYHTSRCGEMTVAEGALRTVGQYFAEGHWLSVTRTGPPGKVGSYHRTLSTYLNSCADAGFILERAIEPRAVSCSSDSPSLSGAQRDVWAEVPAVFVAWYRKPASEPMPHVLSR